MFTALVAPPGAEAIRTPGALPYNAEAKLGEPVRVIASDLIVLVAYPSDFWSFLTPKAVTTTSDN